MTKKDLEQFLSIKCEIKQLNEHKELLEEQKTSIKSQIITDLPKGGGTAKLLEDLMVEIEDVIVDIAKKSVDLATQLLNIENSIENLNSNERRLIRYKYMKGMPYSKIEGRMSYSIRHLKRMHAEILEKIE
ncbi:sigma-70 family RNA polymerase sigma factor [Terrisporobacter hibernicus]|uniref:RNA polymerase sigma-70 region 4 domain-containing protein n=1 Tax=Terrisporobacter hibernicus TaxID=2813371 RepID=A0AAX2ZDL4_9FIRM|nr:hypothetical protein [Terrisporobacter hibernicus]UEL47343.1 hypothetical protein JW646_17185 [Terrisporobacter hibernicus]